MRHSVSVSTPFWQNPQSTYTVVRQINESITCPILSEAKQDVQTDFYNSDVGESSESVMQGASNLQTLSNYIPSRVINGCRPKPPKLWHCHTQ
jgi:hypothetical protein